MISWLSFLVCAAETMIMGLSIVTCDEVWSQEGLMSYPMVVFNSIDDEHVGCSRIDALFMSHCPLGFCKIRALTFCPSLDVFNFDQGKRIGISKWSSW